MDPELTLGAAPLEAVGLSDVGLRREQQEDALFVGGDLLVVADGLGGHAGGEVASAAAVASISAALAGPHEGDLAAAVVRAVAAAHDAVIAAGQAAGAWDAGTTVALAWRPAGARELLVAHVGDSRVGWVAADGLVWLTEDHNEAAEMVALGRLTVEQAYGLGLQHSLARCLGGGFSSPATPDIATFDVSQGGRLVLCTDGLCGYVTDQLVSEVIAQGDPLVDTVLALGQLTRDVGAPDNVTIILADLPSLGSTA